MYACYYAGHVQFRWAIAACDLNHIRLPLWPLCVCLESNFALADCSHRVLPNCYCCFCSHVARIEHLGLSLCPLRLANLFRDAPDPNTSVPSLCGLEQSRISDLLACVLVTQPGSPLAIGSHVASATCDKVSMRCSALVDLWAPEGCSGCRKCKWLQAKGRDHGIPQ